jgi:hypothetical protein
MLIKSEKNKKFFVKKNGHEHDRKEFFFKLNYLFNSIIIYLYNIYI